MTKDDFREIDKKNSYIADLLTDHMKQMQKELMPFFAPLEQQLKEHGFILCLHCHHHPVKLSVYDGTDDDSMHLTIQDFEIRDQSDGFPSDILATIENWLQAKN